jgi:ribonuclease HI
MKKPKHNFYVVWEGWHTGIADSWEKCQTWIDGYRGAKYKGFALPEEAAEAFKRDYSSYYQKKQDNSPKTIISSPDSTGGKPILRSIAVDAACSSNPGTLEYRGVFTETGQQIFHQGPFPLGTVNIGEFLAITHGLAYLKKYNFDIPLYTDSRTAIKWVRDKEIKTKLHRDEETEELFKLIDRALSWLTSNTWETKILKWETEYWGEIPADFGRK